MSDNKTRGLADDDDRFFATAKIPKLKAAQEELQFLLNRGYPIKSAMTFIGNHHQLTVRQALAVTRATASLNNLEIRKNKRLNADGLEGKTVYIDGFNIIITLEVSLSDGMLFIGQDGCIRDLAEQRGTYRIITQTHKAVDLIRSALEKLEVGGAVFYIDQPVSNSGRLKETIFDTEWAMPVEADIVRNPDSLLKELPCVVTSDSVILDECQSWFNLTEYILVQSGFNLTRLVDLK